MKNIIQDPKEIQIIIMIFRMENNRNKVYRK
jgi:hypothetical protein